MALLQRTQRAGRLLGQIEQLSQLSSLSSSELGLVDGELLVSEINGREVERENDDNRISPSFFILHR
jgi:hypothetical protein